MIMRFHLMEDLVSEICSVDDEDELHAALMTAARRMCFDHFALVYDRRAGDDAEANLLIHDYPDAWANVYVDFDLGGADPVRRAGERSLVGFERSEEHKSELQSLLRTSYAVFCLKKQH